MELRNIKDILPYEKNAKKHPKKQVEQVAASIKEFGFNQPLVVDKNNVLIVGHGRLEAAKLLGLKEVPTITVDLTEEQAKSYRLADNKLNESDWDMNLVIEELKGLSPEMIDLSGFGDLDIESTQPLELDDEYKNNKPRITVTFLSVEDLENAKVDIEEIIAKYEGSYIGMISGGEL